MASAWGNSWGGSWGDSWAAGVSPPPDARVISARGRDDTTITVRGSRAVAIRKNIEFFRGETVSIKVEVDGETSLSGRTFRLAISAPAGSLLLALTQGSGITLDSPLGGWLTAAITATQSAALAAAKDSWGVAETTGGGEAVLTYGQCGVLSAPPLPPP